ncbi:response regulator [Qipengyuania sp. DGS5-3]|uniref:response regulator n=1 Tax=Qipengyuania sp. DGS5-3 TaxID=3349632 RepID=UPI0036D3AC1A
MTLAQKLAATKQDTQAAGDSSEQAVNPQASDPVEVGVPASLDDTEPAAPAAQTDAIVASAKAMRQVNQARVGKKVCLIVDDSRMIRKVSRKIAESLGYSVAEAENGEEALTRCKSGMPDLVLTDWQMPVMSGPDFVANLRKLPTQKAPVVVFCTSKGEATDIHEGISAGADDYIVKPFDEAALRTKLAKLGVG